MRRDLFALNDAEVSDIEKIVCALRTTLLLCFASPAAILTQHNPRPQARGFAFNHVLLDANPLEDIRNTTKINAVVVNGRLLPRQRLDEMLRGVQAKAAAKKNSSARRTAARA